MVVKIKTGDTVKVPIHLLLPEEIIRQLDEMAANSSVSRIEIIRRAIAAYWDKFCDRMGQ